MTHNSKKRSCNDTRRLRWILRIAKRNTKRCEFCTSKDDITIHHKNGNLEDERPENLQVLCRFCHDNVHDLEKGLLVGEEQR